MASDLCFSMLHNPGAAVLLFRPGSSTVGWEFVDLVVTKKTRPPLGKCLSDPSKPPM